MASSSLTTWARHNITVSRIGSTAGDINDTMMTQPSDVNEYSTTYFAQGMQPEMPIHRMPSCAMQ